MKIKHKPPSRTRYELEHPTVSIRVDRPTYDQLKELKKLGAKSLGDILREALKKQTPSAEKAHDAAYKEGYQDATKAYLVSYKCSGCGGDMTLSSEEEKKDAAQYMREHGWRHKKCVK